MIRRLIAFAIVVLVVAVVPEAAGHYLFESGVAAAVGASGDDWDGSGAGGLDCFSIR